MIKEVLLAARFCIHTRRAGKFPEISDCRQ